MILSLPLVSGNINENNYDTGLKVFKPDEETLPLLKLPFNTGVNPKNTDRPPPLCNLVLGGGEVPRPDSSGVEAVLHRPIGHLLDLGGFLLALDHKPLLPILADKELGDIANLRLMYQKVKLLRFRFTHIYIPDAWSRRTDSPNPPIPKHNNVNMLDSAPTMLSCRTKRRCTMAEWLLCVSLLERRND